MRWVAAAAWCLLASLAYAQSLVRYPGDRAQGGNTTSSGTPAPSAKRIATIGDSNTEGYGLAGNETYPARLAVQLGGAYTVDNYGVGGHTCTQTSARFDSTVKPLAYGVVVLMCGTNDHRTHGDSAATIYRRIFNEPSAEYPVAGLVQKIQATGARVVLMTVLPAGTSYDPSYTPAMEATRDALNALIRGTSGVTVVDLDLLLQGSGEPPALLQALPDGLHLGPSGAITVATAVKNVLAP